MPRLFEECLTASTYGAKSTLKLLATAKALPTHLHTTIDFAELLAGMTFGNDLEYDPVPESSLTIPCPDWWGNQPVFFRDNRMYTRKDIVLSAANKDGGAHVDVPDNGLLALQEGFWIRTTTNSAGVMTTTSLENNHFRMLRRFADELLNSKELTGLAD